ncbi:MAG: putative selenate ABC transporter substrate-binding protein [Betaproteobacteria bacterium TMED156]|nr:MAG: putative selenate ABC transporter substrate-binding protein [Betaproteobacteria bacterium TMED156]
MYFKKILLSLTFLLIFLSITGCSDTSNNSKDIFRITAIPDESPTELARKAEPLMKYLSQIIGREVVYYPVTDYSAAVEALVNKKVEMAWFGGFTYVQAKIRSNGEVIPIIQRIEDQGFKSVFITSDPSIQSLSDLKGKKVSFGSVSSTSGHLWPRSFLLKEGVNPEKDFKRVAFSGAHDATIISVGSGKVQAGALNIKVWEKFIEKEMVPERVRVFYTTPGYYNYNWTIHKDVPKKTRDKIIDGFIQLSDQTDIGKEILSLQRASGFITTNDDNYIGLEKAAKSADLIK